MTNVIILAGGSGKRMSSRTTPKQFLQLYGKEIIIYTLENFEQHPEINNIVIVCKMDWIDFMQTLIKKYNISKVKWIVPGGASGQESIFNGLSELEKHTPDDSVVLIHDGVRPLITQVLISDCIKSVKEHGSAVTVSPAVETIVTVDDKKVISITERSKCCYGKAPQGFYLKDIISVHRKAITDGNTQMVDSASLMTFYGYKLWTVNGNSDNIKITTPSDFYTFRALYDARENQQIAGF